MEERQDMRMFKVDGLFSPPLALEADRVRRRRCCAAGELDGTCAFRKRCIDTAGLALALYRAAEAHQPFASIALCDGEAQTLLAARGFQAYHYLSTYGFPADEREAVAEDMVAAIGKADVVSLPRSGPVAMTPNFGPKLRTAMDLWGAAPKLEALIGDSMSTMYLVLDGWLWGLIERSNILVVNNLAEEAAEAIRSRTYNPGLPKLPGEGVEVGEVAAITLEDGQDGSAKALDEAAAIPSDRRPDVVLVGAGARAAHLCVSLAEIFDAVVVELGDTVRMLHQESDPEGWAMIYSWYQREG